MKRKILNVNLENVKSSVWKTSGTLSAWPMRKKCSSLIKEVKVTKGVEKLAIML